jgi:hypothetical protein
MRRYLVALILQATFGACSFIETRGPASRGLKCTDIPIAPTVDLLLTAASIGGATAAIVSAARSDCGPDYDVSCGIEGFLAIPALLVAIPYGLSAIYGYSTVSSCKTYRRSYERALRGDCSSLVELVTQERLEVDPATGELESAPGLESELFRRCVASESTRSP